MSRNGIAFLLFLGLFALCGAIGHVVDNYLLAIGGAAAIGLAGMVIGGAVIVLTTDDPE